MANPEIPFNGGLSTPTGPGALHLVQTLTALANRIGLAAGYGFAHTLCTGSGTEQSPYVCTDGTGGIQTYVNQLATNANDGSSPGGGIVGLANCRYNLSAEVAVRVPVEIRGVQSNIGWPEAAAEPLNGTRLKGLGSGKAYFRIGYGASGTDTRPGRITLRDFSLYGNGGQDPTAPTSGNNWTDGSTLGIWIDQSTDQAHFENLSIVSCGVGFLCSSNGDSFTAHRLAIHSCAYPMIFDGNSRPYYGLVADCTISDNDYSIFALPTGSTTYRLQFVNCRIAANGRLSTSNACNIYLGQPETLILGGAVDYPGDSFRGLSTVAADGIIVAANGCEIRTHITDNQAATLSFSPGGATAGVRVLSGVVGTIIDSKFARNAGQDIIVMSGAVDTTIRCEQGTKITDNGARTIINGMGTNAGDPDVMGYWLNAAKQPGLMIRDTTNNVTYLYHAAGTSGNRQVL